FSERNVDLEPHRSRRFLWKNIIVPSLLISVLEFQKIAMATVIGFAIMSFIGFFVKPLAAGQCGKVVVGG
uniref:Uncharacterized protein n=1 Tax=Oncorhynchus kisutch TaxID=8019 RepID=A0A8C7L1R1_ONCKI